MVWSLVELLYDELKSLAVHLSPSVRVSGGEVGDVLSALIAYAEHGQPVVDAAHQGPQALYDFFHEHLVKLAEDAGEGPPRKGQPLQHEPAPGRFGPPPAVSRSDFAELKALVEQLLAAQGIAPAAAAPAAAPAPPLFAPATDVPAAPPPVPAPAAEQALTPDQVRAIARAHQAQQDAERLAHDTPQPETGEIPAPATWTPPDEAA